MPLTEVWGLKRQRKENSDILKSVTKALGMYVLEFCCLALTCLVCPDSLVCLASLEPHVSLDNPHQTSTSITTGQ